MKLRNQGRRRAFALRAAALLLCLLTALPLMAGCDPAPTEAEHIDYVAQTKLDLTSDSKKIAARVKVNIDGDTTHFYVDDTTTFPEGIVKARYLAIDTPESTGRLEEWGKTASKFTKETLAGAVEIMLESDDNKWNVDSNGRHLLWVWYKTSAEADWRCLNIEILQSGLAVGSNSGQNRYGQTCLAALAQAGREKRYVHSGEQDPTFPYGEATAVSIKELRLNKEAYEGVKVAVEGVISQSGDGTLYIEEYDEEDGRSYGMQVFYGYNMATSAVRFLKVAGNRVCLVGTFQYSEVVNAYQIAGLSYDAMKPNDPSNTHLVESGADIPVTEITDLSAFNTATHDFVVSGEEGEVTVTLAESELALYTAVSLTGLTVKSVYTTTSEASSQKGALTLTCEKDGQTVTIRTVVLYDEGTLVTADRLEGKVIDVKGIVDSYTREGSDEATEQIKVFSFGSITIH